MIVGCFVGFMFYMVSVVVVVLVRLFYEFLVEFCYIVLDFLLFVLLLLKSWNWEIIKLVLGLVKVVIVWLLVVELE